MANILIVGCGAVGGQLAHNLAQQGHTVTGIKRSPSVTAGSSVRMFAADISQASTLAKIDDNFDRLVFAVSADGRTEASYRSVYQAGLDNVLAKFPSIPWLFVSSTSVYGQNQGEWVDEHSPAEPTQRNSQLIRTAEKKVTAANQNNIVVRCSGIYGANRRHLLDNAAQTPVIQQTPAYYTNRIHQDDCVGVLAFLLRQSLAGATLAQCYLASDDDPAPLWEVMIWLAEQQAYAPPIAKPVEIPAVQNKRCANQRLKALGYQFIYPSFREGYGTLIAR